MDNSNNLTTDNQISNVDDNKIIENQNLINNEKKWEEFHKSFEDKQSPNLWEINNFSHQQAQEWKDILGDKFRYYSLSFCMWLRDEKKLSLLEIKDKLDIKILKDEYKKAWKIIHEDFVIDNEWDRGGYLNTHRRTWEEIYEITFIEMKKLIKFGLNPRDSRFIDDWKNLDFTIQQIIYWIKKGFNIKDFYLAAYHRNSKFKSIKGLDIKEIKKIEISAEELLDTIFPVLDKRKKVTVLDIESLNIIGVLDLSDFTNLEYLNCSDNLLTDLILYENLTNLEYLDIRSNNFDEQDLSYFYDSMSLTELLIGNENKIKIEAGIYNRFVGSLDFLKNLSELYILNINNTDIEEGLESLWGCRIEQFYCLNNLRPEAKVKNINRFIDQRSENFEQQLREYELNLENEAKEKQIQILKEEKIQFNEKEKIINYLEIHIQNLVNYIKNQKEKIIEDFLNLLPEKDLIQELITKYLEFKKAENQNLQIRKLERACNKIKDDLEDILGEDFVENLQPILTGCEKLISWENELENCLKNKIIYIEQQKQIAKQIAYNSENEEIIVQHEEIQEAQKSQFDSFEKENLIQQLEIAKAKIETYEKLIPVDKKEQLLSEFANNRIFFDNLFIQVYNYINSKQSFINLREETLILLKEIVNLIERKTVLNSGKYVRIEDGINIIKPIFKITSIVEGMLGANEVPGEVISVVFNNYKRKFNQRNSEIFRDHLIRNDNSLEVKNNRILLEELVKKSDLEYSKLIRELFNLDKEVRIFSEEYEVYKVATNLWKNKPIITIDDMKSAISELTKNVNILKRELKSEMNEINKLNVFVKLESKLMICSIQQN